MGGKVEKPMSGQSETSGSRDVPRDLRKQMRNLASTGSNVRTLADLQELYGHGVKVIEQTPSTA